MWPWAHCKPMCLIHAPAPYPCSHPYLRQIRDQLFHGAPSERKGPPRIARVAGAPIGGLHVINGGRGQGAVPTHDPQPICFASSVSGPGDQAVGLLGRPSTARQGICRGGGVYGLVLSCAWCPPQNTSPSVVFPTVQSSRKPERANLIGRV